MYFLIGIWGHENRVYAAVKFFLFTQASGLLMLRGDPRPVLRPRPGDRRLHLRLHASCSARRCRRRRRCWLMLGFFVGLRRQAAGRAAPHLAARRPHRGADGRQRDPGRAAAEDRRLRPAALRRAALPRGGARLRAGGDGAGRSSASSTARCWPSPRPTSSGWSPTPASATWASCCWASSPGTSWRCRAR